MITIRPEKGTDTLAREHLLNRAFGEKRFRKTSERLRSGRLPAEGLAFSAVDEKGKLVGTVRLWDIVAGSAGMSLLLGPLAVDKTARGKGLGSALMQHALAEAAKLGHESVLLVGDEPYYGRFGFATAATRDLHLPGPVERERFLGVELVPGALDGAEGLVSAAGRMIETGREAKAA